MGDRWEKERGSWVLARAGHRAAARRRGEKLMVSARRSDRYDVGAGDASFSEVTTRNVLYRSVMREEGAANTAGWFCFTAIWVLWLVLLVGPGLVISRIAYGLWWVMVPKWGRMFPLPYVGLAAAAGGVGWLALDHLALEGFVAVLAHCTAIQLVLGLAWAGWLVRVNGWSAVARRQKQSGAKVDRIIVPVHQPPAVEPIEIGPPEPEQTETPTPQTSLPECEGTRQNIDPINVGPFEQSTDSPR